MSDQNKQNNSSPGLAAIIVAYRSLGIFKDEARNAMIELARRKDAGETFDIDGYIKEKLDQVPKSIVNQEVMHMLEAMGSIGNAR